MDNFAPEAPISFTGELIYVEPIGDLEIEDENVNIYESEDYDERIYFDNDKLKEESIDYHELVDNQVRNKNSTVMVVFGSENEEEEKYVELPIKGIKSIDNGTAYVKQEEILEAYELWAIIDDHDKVQLKVEYPPARGILSKLGVILRYLTPRVSIKEPPENLKKKIESKTYPNIDIEQVREAERRQEEEIGYDDSQEKPGLSIGQVIVEKHDSEIKYNALVYRDVLRS